MKKMGPFGINYQIAVKNAMTAKTPEARKFRAKLINNDEARGVVDKVDFVKNSLTQLDGNKATDLNVDSGAVKIDTQIKNPGFFGRKLAGLGDPVKGIAAQAPSDGSKKVQVSGELNNDDLSVSIESDKGQKTQISQTTQEDGAVVYKAGNDVVTMNADGTLSMGTAVEPSKQEMNAWYEPGSSSINFADHGTGGESFEIAAWESITSGKDPV